VFENRALRRIFGPKRDKVRGKCVMRSYITGNLRQIKFEYQVKEEMGTVYNTYE
jgi:hypothetical protein